MAHSSTCRVGGFAGTALKDRLFVDRRSCLDRMPATDRVAKGLQIPPELDGVLLCDPLHPYSQHRSGRATHVGEADTPFPPALLIQGLDALVDGALGLVVVGEAEAGAPVAKVARDDEQVGGVGQVGRQQRAVLALPCSKARGNASAFIGFGPHSPTPPCSSSLPSELRAPTMIGTSVNGAPPIAFKM